MGDTCACMFYCMNKQTCAQLSNTPLQSMLSSVLFVTSPQAVAIVLGFIGVKMVLGLADVDVPTDLSLLIVGIVLGGGVGASLLLPEPAETD